MGVVIAELAQANCSLSASSGPSGGIWRARSLPDDGGGRRITLQNSRRRGLSGRDLVSENRCRFVPYFGGSLPFHAVFGLFFLSTMSSHIGYFRAQVQRVTGKKEPHHEDGAVPEVGFRLL